MSDSVRVTVSYGCGAHSTNTVRGQRASSTAGYIQAAEAVGKRLFPDQKLHIERVDEQTAVAVCVFDIRPEA